MKKKSAILIAAPQSGSGKTTVACALMQALLQRGRTVRAFKCGPDYIDPMYHRKVIGVPSRNLDTFFSEEEQIRELFERDREQGSISVIEGVMGLYDGLGGIRKEGSAYHLAQVLDIPVVLVLDAHGMGRTVIPLLAGLLSYDTDHRIAGVILNRTSGSFCATIAPLIEEELKLPVLGFFPKISQMQLDSRHLGLKMPDELEGLRQQLQQAAKVLEENVSLERLERIAQDWAKEENAAGHGQGEKTTLRGKKVLLEEQNSSQEESEPVRVAIAQDEVFCFYYEDNLRMLRLEGVQLVPFSPLHDKALPPDVCGILLGGGYPELRAKELSLNESMRSSVRRAIAGGMPSVAECGGFLYLHEFMQGEDGGCYPMAGILPGGSHNTGKLVRFGYITLQEKEPCFLGEGMQIKAHEFHYFDCEENGNSCVAVKPAVGKSWECVHTGNDHWWGFPHLYYPSNPAFPERFAAKCREFHQKAEEI